MALIKDLAEPLHAPRGGEKTFAAHAQRGLGLSVCSVTVLNVSLLQCSFVPQTIQLT